MVKVEKEVRYKQIIVRTGGITMAKKLVVSFPGGRGTEIPLLYFTAKKYEDLGYEKVFINHPLQWDETLDSLLENAEKVIQCIDFQAYDEVIFVAKSIGTLVACKLKEKYDIHAKLILFTPLEGAWTYITQNNDVLYVAGGEKDRYFDSMELMQLCEREMINCYIEKNVGHRMEIMGDLRRNLGIISNVLEKL